MDCTLIQIVQGDSYNFKIIVEKGIELINKLYFSSGNLNIIKEAEKVTSQNETFFIVKFTSLETQNLKCCCTTYDITAELENDQVRTTIYNGTLKVLKKGNKIYGD